MDVLIKQVQPPIYKQLFYFSKRKVKVRMVSSFCSLQARVPAGELLPPGWAMQRTPNGRIFFIDHNTRKTTWVSV